MSHWLSTLYSPAGTPAVWGWPSWSPAWPSHPLWSWSLTSAACGGAFHSGLSDADPSSSEEKRIKDKITEHANYSKLDYYLQRFFITWKDSSSSEGNRIYKKITEHANYSKVCFMTLFVFAKICNFLENCHPFFGKIHYMCVMNFFRFYIIA